MDLVSRQSIDDRSELFIYKFNKTSISLVFVECEIIIRALHDFLTNFLK